VFPVFPVFYIPVYDWLWHGPVAGIFCTAIAGGAIFSLLIGKLKDLLGLQAGMMILYLPLMYILSLSFWAKPIVQNATIRKKV
jgi:fucose permease